MFVVLNTNLKPFHARINQVLLYDLSRKPKYLFEIFVMAFHTNIEFHFNFVLYNFYFRNIFLLMSFVLFLIFRFLFNRIHVQKHCGSTHTVLYCPLSAPSASLAMYSISSFWQDVTCTARHIFIWEVSWLLEYEGSWVVPTTVNQHFKGGNACIRNRMKKIKCHVFILFA